MSSTSRFAGVARRIEDWGWSLLSEGPRASAGAPGPEEVSRRARRSEVALAEALAVLDRMESSGEWERVLVDERGGPLSPEQVDAILAGALFGAGDRVRVEWRRCERTAILRA